jgi:hypothetical protein
MDYGDKMKKTVFCIILTLILCLTACAAQVPTPNADTGQSTTQEQPIVQVQATGMPTAIAGATATEVSNVINLDTSYDNAVPVAVQLLVGTLNLTETEQAITKEQAASLLPLWNEFKTFSQSMAPAQTQGNSTPQTQTNSSDVQAQIDTLVKQIQAAMTPAQIKAITAMKISRENMQSILQAQGITMGGPQQGSGNNTGNGNQPPQGTPPASASGNNDGAGAPPTGNQSSDNKQQPGGNAQQMPGGPVGGEMIPPDLVDALIQTLEKTSGVQSSSTTSQNPTGDSANSASTSSTTEAAYTLNSGTANLSNQTYTAANIDESAVYVTNGGVLTLKNASVTTSGNTSSADNSSFHGLNAAVLAADKGTINLSDSKVSTTGSGANGVFATGSGSAVTLSNVTIQATGDGGHAVMATNSGALTLTNVNMNTSGPHSGAIATDRGGGTINASGGKVSTSGQDSPAIYSTGSIKVTGATLSASGAEAAVIEGANSITLIDSSLSSSKDGKWGVMIYQSFSGDAQGSDGLFNMTGGSLTYNATSGPLFFVTNSTGIITLKGVKITVPTGMLIQAGGTERWGKAGANGGTVKLTAIGQDLVGNSIADAISSLSLSLQNGSTLTGAINADHKAKAASLELDATSTWTVTTDSYLTGLTDTSGISGTTVTNIIGNGHTIYYDSSTCPTLGGKTYSLSGGGTLKPVN